jgi:flagellar hook-associated protein 3 FlgL
MRVSTANSYDTTVNTLAKRQAELTQQQERLSTGKRVLRASDDPVAATLAETAQNRLSRVQADLRALESSRSSIAQAESGLAESGDLLQNVREHLVKAGNGVYSANDREDIAKVLEGLREQLIAVANRTDNAGRTLYGGLGGSNTPFVDLYGPSGAGVQFQGQRGQQAAGNRSLPQTLDGEAIWMRVPPGNGGFRVDLDSANVSGLHTSLGQVTDAASVTGDSYRVSFADVAGTLQYTVTNQTTGTPVAGHTGVPYESGKSIEFDGMSFAMTGAAADGDAVDVTPVTGPTDIFKVVQDAIDALRLTGPGSDTHRSQDLARSLAEVDSGLDRVLLARGRAGEWLNRADSLDTLMNTSATAHEVEKSRLEDLDLVKGISDFQSQQLGLEAAIKSYAQVQRLSLFSAIG